MKVTPAYEGLCDLLDRRGLRLELGAARKVNLLSGRVWYLRVTAPNGVQRAFAEARSHSLARVLDRLVDKIRSELGVDE